MSFTDRKPFTVQENSSFRKPFHCGLCGHDFIVGDVARWVYANSTAMHRTGNFFVCDACDTGIDDELIKYSTYLYDEFLKDSKTKYKRFVELLKC